MDRFGSGSGRARQYPHERSIMVEHETDESGSTYRAFLVRLWQDRPQALWRASAQSVHNGEVRRFASLPDLFAFLEANTNSAHPPEAGSENQLL